MLSDMDTCLQEKLLSILEYTLGRLARYDEGNPIGALLSMAVSLNSSKIQVTKNILAQAK